MWAADFSRLFAIEKQSKLHEKRMLQEMSKMTGQVGAWRTK